MYISVKINKGILVVAFLTLDYFKLNICSRARCLHQQLPRDVDGHFGCLSAFLCCLVLSKQSAVTEPKQLIRKPENKHNKPNSLLTVKCSTERGNCRVR